MSEKSIPIFDGTGEAYWWLIQLDRYFEANSWIHEERKVSWVYLFALRGGAANWCISWKKGNQAVTWKAFEMAFIKKFIPDLWEMIEVAEEVEQGNGNSVQNETAKEDDESKDGDEVVQALGEMKKKEENPEEEVEIQSKATPASDACAATEKSEKMKEKPPSESTYGFERQIAYRLEDRTPPRKPPDSGPFATALPEPEPLDIGQLAATLPQPESSSKSSDRKFLLEARENQRAWRLTMAPPPPKPPDADLYAVPVKVKEAASDSEAEKRMGNGSRKTHGAANFNGLNPETRGSFAIRDPDGCNPSGRPGFLGPGLVDDSRSKPTACNFFGPELNGTTLSLALFNSRAEGKNNNDEDRNRVGCELLERKEKAILRPASPPKPLDVNRHVTQLLEPRSAGQRATVPPQLGPRGTELLATTRGLPSWYRIREESSPMEQKDGGARMVTCKLSSILNLMGLAQNDNWVSLRISHVHLEPYFAILIPNASILRSSPKTDCIGAIHDVLLSTNKCCNIPYVVDPPVQNLLLNDLEAVEYLDVGIKASGKLQLLDSRHTELRKKDLRVLVLFQSTGGSGSDTIGDILDDFVRQRFGLDSHERIDKGLLSYACATFLCICLGKLKACAYDVEVIAIVNTYSKCGSWGSVSEVVN